MDTDNEDVDISTELSDMESLLSEDLEVTVEPEEEEKKSRKDKRKERGELWSSFQQEREARVRAETEARLLRERSTGMEELLREQPQRQTQEAPNPVRARLDGLYAQAEALNARYDQGVASKTLTPEAVQAMRREHRLLNEQIQATIAAAVAQPKQEQADPSHAIKQANYLRNRDVYDDRAALKWAEAQFLLQEAEYEATGQHYDPQALHDQVMQKTRQKFNMRRADDTREPSQADRRRHASHGTSRAGGGDGGKKKIVMTKDYRQMADALYSEISDPKERYQKWAREIGSDLV